MDLKTENNIDGLERCSTLPVGSRNVCDDAALCRQTCSFPAFALAELLLQLVDEVAEQSLSLGIYGVAVSAGNRRGPNREDMDVADHLASSRPCLPSFCHGGTRALSSRRTGRRDGSPDCAATVEASANFLAFRDIQVGNVRAESARPISTVSCS